MKEIKVTETEIMENLKICPHFNTCSYNLCPLDLELELRTGDIKEDGCNWMQNYRTKNRRHIRRPMPEGLLKFVPKKNVKMLNKSNRKRWYALHQNFNSY